MKENQPNWKNLLLVAFLIIAAFVIGSMYTKVQYLEKSETSSSKTTTAQTLPQAAAPNQPNQPNQPPPAQPATGKIKPVSDSDHIRGNKNAKITLVEYSDLECPFCQRFHPTMQEIMKTYGDKVRWVYRHYPLPFHANAAKEDEASECIATLAGNDKFWEYIDKIFERTTSNGTGFALDKLGPLAGEIGVNQTQFQSCFDSGKYAQHVKDDIADGSSGGVSGTPSTFVIDSKGDSKIIVGAQPLSAFKSAIDAALKE